MPDDKKIEDEKAPEGVDKVLEELKNLSEKIVTTKPDEKTPPAPAAPTYADRRAQLQKSLGYTDEQMSAHEEMIRQANAPVVESTAWQKLEKRPDIDKYRDEIKAELDIYPQDRRTPEIMEKVYYMVKGRHADSKGPDPKDPKAPTERVSRGPGYNGSDPGLAGGGDRAGSDEELDEREKLVADKLGVDHKGYAESKKIGKEIRGLRLPDARPASSMADIELRRLQGRR